MRFDITDYTVGEFEELITNSPFLSWKWVNGMAYIKRYKDKIDLVIL